ncbi:MAG: copper-transporting P-type ATPase, partial [Actinomycetota bacterium]|nr:copper-transporting P-type ATPase [Actinomycetota bacterium]
MSAKVQEHEVVLDIEGMTCASCVNKLEKALSGVEEVNSASVNLATRTATVHTGAPETGPLITAVQRAGYGARPHTDERSPGEETRFFARRLSVAAPLTLVVLALTFLVPSWSGSTWLAWAFATPVQFYAGWPFLRSAARAARHGTTTMDTLVAIGSLAAYAYSV